MDNYNGRIFKDSISLFSVLKVKISWFFTKFNDFLKELLHEYPKNKGILDKYRENALKFRDSPFSEGFYAINTFFNKFILFRVEE